MIMNSFLMSDISMQEMRVCRQTYPQDVICGDGGHHEKLSLATGKNESRGGMPKRLTIITGQMYE